MNPKPEPHSSACSIPDPPDQRPARATTALVPALATTVSTTTPTKFFNDSMRRIPKDLRQTPPYQARGFVGKRFAPRGGRGRAAGFGFRGDNGSRPGPSPL